MPKIINYKHILWQLCINITQNDNKGTIFCTHELSYTKKMTKEWDFLQFIYYLCRKYCKEIKINSKKDMADFHNRRQDIIARNGHG